MKIKSNAGEFKPFDLTITIQNKSELEALCLAMEGINNDTGIQMANGVSKNIKTNPTQLNAVCKPIFSHLF